jgi:eukaryotic-like serine/threonine-protein kinase
MNAPGTLLAGKYQLEAIAGTGGMATVWRALQRGPAGFERSVGIKLIRGELAYDPAFVAMFVEEARVSSQLIHPNIVQVYDFGEDGGQYFLVMEWVDGLSLAHYQRRVAERGENTDWPLLAGVAIEALRGLGSAHERRDAEGRPAPVFHRDVTPQNILLGRNGVVKLSDFGLARATDRARMTAPDVVKGKVGYLAPELARVPEPNAQSDIYSIGVVMWQALAGRRLFQGKDDVEVFLAASRGEVPPLADLRPDVPQEMCAIVERSLAMDPADRFASAGQMARVLSRMLLVAGREGDARAVAEGVNAALT